MTLFKKSRGVGEAAVTLKRSRIKAMATFNSSMANCCPMQFLQGEATVRKSNDHKSQKLQ